MILKLSDVCYAPTGLKIHLSERQVKKKKECCYTFVKVNKAGKSIFRQEK